MYSWQEIEEKRVALGISRAEMCRRAAISESTVFKGLQRGTRPLPSIYRALSWVLREEQERSDALEKRAAE